MNIASWIILIIIAIWIGIAVKVAFFGGFGKKGHSCHGARHEADLPSDEDLKLPSACMGCSKGSWCRLRERIRQVRYTYAHHPRIARVRSLLRPIAHATYGDAASRGAGRIRTREKRGK